MPPRNKATFTEMERRFVDHFNGNQTEAARLAGYKDPNKAASKVMARKHVYAEIQKKLSAATTESAKRTIRKITFGRNDIIAALGDLGGLGDPAKKAESESAQASCLRTLADMYDLIPKSSDKNVGLFKGWTDEELEEYRLTGTLPPRFGVRAEDYNANSTGNDTGLRASGLSVAEGPPVGNGIRDGRNIPPPPPARK